MVMNATGSMFHSLGPFKVAAKRRVPYLGSNRATDKGKVAFKIRCSIDSQDQPARISRLRRIVEVFLLASDSTISQLQSCWRA